MNKCNFCGVEILDKSGHCPLCNGVLDGDHDGRNTYPDLYNEVKKANFVYRLLMFLCILGIVGIDLGCFVLTNTYKWGIIAVLCVIYTMWMLYVSFNDRAGYRVRILTGVFFAVILVILIDWIIGYNGWSINYILPSTMLFVDLLIVILMFINKRSWQSYLVFQIGMVLICLIPAIFIKIGLIYKPIVAEVAIAVTVVECIASIMLGGATAKHELKRRFHVR
ncbi:MAG: hypothetical protein K6B67_03995 [Lachnospiraceae bacterium]|nr:hypothetical protein [Lachnospiraceae bacterium]